MDKDRHIDRLTDNQKNLSGKVSIDYPCKGDIQALYKVHMTIFP